jgi:hypothetical protein
METSNTENERAPTEAAAPLTYAQLFQMAVALCPPDHSFVIGCETWSHCRDGGRRAEPETAWKLSYIGSRLRQDANVICVTAASADELVDAMRLALARTDLPKVTTLPADEQEIGEVSL